MRSIFDMTQPKFESTILACSRIIRGRCGRDRILVGFTTTCAISPYHH